MRLDSPGLPFTDAPKLVGDLPMRCGATFSPDARCRMTLSRFWGDGPHVLVIGANPSNAGRERNDPTSLAWVHFVRAWGYAGYVAVNPIPRISATPKAAVQWYRSRLFGDAAVAAMMEANLAIINREAGRAALHVACWGNLIDDEKLLAQVVEAVGADLYCFGTTKDGRPKHVLARGKHRVPIDQQPVLWRRA